MEYLVNEIVQTGSPAGDARVFKTLPEAFQFIRKRNKESKILIGESETTLEELAIILNEWLATVTLSLENDPGRKLVITAF